jgi:phospholipid/cholesterol/gamma-HCH transport system permease protein
MQRVLDYSLEYIDGIGKKVVSQFAFLHEINFLIYLSLRNFFKILIHPVDNSGKLSSIYRVTVMQIYFTGIQALPIVSLMALATGSFTVLQVTQKLAILGQEDLIGRVLVAVVLREVAPLFTAFVVVARSGTAIAAELGSMKVNKEFQSLQAMGIDYPSFVIFPRLFGGTLSLLCLTVFFVLISFWGGYLVADLIEPFPFSNYLNAISNNFHFIDFLNVILKCLIVGLVVFGICSQCGLSVQRSSHEVPQVTTKAMVWSITMMVLINITLTILFYLF